MTDVALRVNGKQYQGWTSVEVHRSMEAVAGSFNLKLTERWPGRSTPWKIMPGDECELLLDGQTVILGYLDSVAPKYDAGRHEITVTGRDATADLVDCSADHKPGQWSDISLERLVQTLAEPFGIGLTVEADTGEAFRTFTLQTGETVWEAIDRAARQRGVLVVSDAAGGLVITRRGTNRAGVQLVEGRNIMAASAELSQEDRFGTYIVKGNQPGTDNLNGEAAAAVSARAEDAGVKRYRPLVVMAEGATNPNVARQRAEWEASVRAGRAQTASVTVQGWQESDGALWVPNRLVTVRSPMLRMDGDLLITGVRYRKGSQRGTTAVLALARPDAYEPKPEVEDTEESPWGGGASYSSNWGSP